MYIYFLNDLQSLIYPAGYYSVSLLPPVIGRDRDRTSRGGAVRVLQYTRGVGETAAAARFLKLMTARGRTIEVLRSRRGCVNPRLYCTHACRCCFVVVVPRCVYIYVRVSLELSLHFAGDDTRSVVYNC